MSLLSRPRVADAIASAMGRAKPRLKKELRFDDIPGVAELVGVPTRHGEVACWLYRPEASTASRGLYVNLHGGGFVVGAPEQDDPLCRYLAARAGVFVLNVDYGCAPAARFPVAVEEAFDAVAWACRPGHEWDCSRLGVGGQSAGGALAAGAARLALEAGAPTIALQVLHYPPLDLVTPAKDKRAGRRHVVISPRMSEVFDTAYVPLAAQRRDRLASPAWGRNAEGIDGIAPALVITCEVDRLRDEGVRYANALRAAGALRAHVDLEGFDHGYNILTTRENAERGYRVIAARVRAVLGADDEAEPEPADPDHRGVDAWPEDDEVNP